MLTIRKQTTDTGVTPQQLNREGELLFERGELESALEKFVHAYELDPDEPETCNNLAVCLWQNGEPAQALLLLSRAIERNPHEQSYIINGGQILCSVGKFAEAEGLYQSHLNDHPDDAVVRGYLQQTRDQARVPVTAPATVCAAANQGEVTRDYSFADITLADIPDELRTALDKGSEPETELQAQWQRDGVLLLEKFLPDDLIECYSELRARLKQPGGWRCPAPYLYYDQIKEIGLYKELTAMYEHLMGNPMGMHLNLTGWVSTERKWHQDRYLNPSPVGNHYVAVWMALDDIHPDSGPFEFVRGSHRWPSMEQDLLLRHYPAEMRLRDSWPTETQYDVHRICEEEMARRGSQVEQLLAKKGDVLIWHANLMHRGSKPNVPGTPRKALICHYSSINHRVDMPAKKLFQGRWGSGWYFDLTVPMSDEERI